MSYLVDGITHRGEGVVRKDGKAVFIPFAVPGEEISMEIIKDQKSFSRGLIREIITPSPDRVDPPCQHYYQCGGCAYQHVNYQRQLLLKKKVVSDALQRIGQQEVSIHDVIGMDNPWYYRNKVTWQVGDIGGEKKLGYYQLDSRRHLAIGDCLIIAPKIKEFSQFLNGNLNETGINCGQQVMIRLDSQGQLFVIMEGPVNKAGLESLVKGYPDLESLFIYQDNELSHVFGSDKMEFIMGERRYLVSPLAFFQVNNQQTVKLYDEVKKTIQPGKSILDAYCGTGSIAIYAAGNNNDVVGIDEFNPSIEDARINASLNHRSHCEFIVGACERVLPDLKKDFDIAILDPPRAGCHQDLLKTIIEQDIPQITYVSCNPATLARDVKILCESSYRIESVQPVDMFPWTSHVECVTLMSRVKE